MTVGDKVKIGDLTLYADVILPIERRVLLIYKKIVDGMEFDEMYGWASFDEVKIC